MWRQCSAPLTRASCSKPPRCLLLETLTFTLLLRQEYRKERRWRLTEMFFEVDKKRDGVLVMSELIRFVSQIVPEFNPGQLRRFHQYLDRDRFVHPLGLHHTSHTRRSSKQSTLELPPGTAGLGLTGATHGTARLQLGHHLVQGAVHGAEAIQELLAAAPQPEPQVHRADPQHAGRQPVRGAGQLAVAQRLPEPGRAAPPAAAAAGRLRRGGAGGDHGACSTQLWRKGRLRDALLSIQRVSFEARPKLD